MHHGRARGDEADRANGCAKASCRCADKSSSAAEQAQPASLLQPEGIYGPAFLTTKNYFVIKEYNFSDLYVLFVGHLADRMMSPQPFATPWSASTQLRTADVEAMQRHLTRIGLYKDKLDGKAGHADPRGARRVPEIGRAQGRLLAERSRAALDQRGALKASHARIVRYRRPP